MNFSQYLKQALNNLFHSKLRTFLAMLGILVGTASVVALVTSGELATKKALEQFKTLGTDLFAVSIFPGETADHSDDSDSSSGAEPITLTLDDVDNLKKQVKGIQGVSPYIGLFVSASFLGHDINSGIIGATAELQKTIQIKLLKGRFVSFLDNYAYFCVIGYKVYMELKKYTLQDPIGQQMQIGTHVFTIVGVAAPWMENAFFNQDINSSILVPIQTSYILQKNASIQNIVLRVDKDVEISSLQQNIDSFVQKYLPSMRTFYRSAQEVISTMKEQTRIFTLLLGFIGSISLLVGGIGVMNVMLVSVAERRREIGIRMAIGARRKDIRMMFLFESVVLAVLGGAIGVVVGVVISNTVAFFAGWGIGIYIFPLILGFLVAATTGVFFGYYPASRASQLDPIETLRHE